MSNAVADDPVLEQAYTHCARITAGKAHSFYFATRFLPAEKRHDVYALYAFCRTVDDVADLPAQDASLDTIRLQLDDWRRWLQAGAPLHADPVRYALAHAVRAHRLPLSPLLELLDALSDDLEPRHLPDAAALERYCYGVAGTVGIVMAALLGAREARAWQPACDLGIAMQLTNVMRDVGEDLARGRIYLPAADMERCGYGRSDLERGVVDERFAGLLRWYIALARDYYTRGLGGLPLLPRESRFPIALAAHSYAGILTRIEQAGYDVFAQRLRTGRRDKLRLALRLGLYHGTAQAFGGAGDRHAISFIRRA
jgi:phytoene synthase